MKAAGKHQSDAFQRFEALTKKLLSVPKKDVDKKEAERPKRQNGKKPA